MPFQKRRTSTRIEIIKYACNLFLTIGYSQTSASKIAKELKLSPGNLTFYFPSKEDLLAVLVDELCLFQRELMETEVNEGYSPILAYCLELASIAAICEENPVARDFYVATYTHEKTLEIIRENDFERAKKMFAEYCPDWSESKWREMENIVSGIEYATIMTREENTPLETQIESTLDTILMLYNVPKELRQIKIKKVLSFNYRTISRSVLEKFKAYVNETNESALKMQKKERQNRFKK